VTNNRDGERNRESADVVAKIVRNRHATRDIAQRIGIAPPPCASCAPGKLWACRGFLKISCRDEASPPVSASAPSVITAFRTPLMLRHALFIVISQSGAPGSYRGDQVGARRGRRTIAISMRLRRRWLTKRSSSFRSNRQRALRSGDQDLIGSMVASAGLVAELAKDRALRSALDRLPSACTARWRSTVRDCR